ncbi:hypothetical protein TNCV_3338711 [Trichonephila clavipes]|nr:hypothetical protein TNCV_3338711 [Trichonephila clavipes]
MDASNLIESNGSKASQRRTLRENVTGRVIAPRCWTPIRFVVEIKRAGRLFTRSNVEGLWSGDPVQICDTCQ